MSSLIPENEKQKIAQLLNEKGVKTTCPMCGRDKFILADGYFNNHIQSGFKNGLELGGPSIPTVAIVCTNCGFTSQHALGVLGLLNNSEKK